MLFRSVGKKEAEATAQHDRFTENKKKAVATSAASSKKSKASEPTDAAHSDSRPPLKDESLRIERADVAILDPPRAGCHEALLEAVVTAAPGRIVYVSCDPATLARDIKWLAARGYEFVEATPCDMFPHTSSVETVALLKK